MIENILHKEAEEILTLLKEREKSTTSDRIDNAIKQKIGNLSILAEDKMQAGEKPQKVLEELYKGIDKESLFHASSYSFISYLNDIKTTYNKVLNAS